jgi:HTH-type transcriptional regulator/antitoxin HigA
VPIPYYNTPGQLIQDLLDRRSWSRRVLAAILGADETGINRLIAGKRPVDATMAIRLSEVFGVRPEHFLMLQKRYDLAQARIVTRPDPERATRARVFGNFPIGEMIKRGWLDADDIRDVPKVEAALLKFFNVPTLEDIKAPEHSAKKSGNEEAELTPPQLAWLHRVQVIANDMLVAEYSPGALREAVTKLSALLNAAEEARKVPRILAECGVRYVIVESLVSAKIDGVAFWLDANSPVIGMTLRHDRIDNFWFVLRHEIEHILQGHGFGSTMLDAELEGERAGIGPNISDDERVANDAAANFCVPQESLQRFIARKAPFFAERDILGFARTLRIHPGLVAGQLQHKTSRYDRFRNHLVKIRSTVAPSAMVDGWGDVAPVGI